nr:winged helix-turn-helix domain-containing protein [Candidatus Shapirobacteria bacterium]
HFPDLNYSPDFWSQINSAKAKSYSANYPQSLIDQIISKIVLPATLDINIDYQKIADKYQIKNEDINILETPFGTGGSYFVTGNQIYISSRVGNTEAGFEKTLILALQKLKNNDTAEIGTVKWHRRQAVAEYLIDQTIPKLSRKIIEDSQVFLTKLGFAPGIPTINFTDFSPQESALLKILVGKQGEIVTFDQTAEIIWGQDSFDKYSPQAMAKVIENIRHKLRGQNINRELIHTKRGFGYCLN